MEGLRWLLRPPAAIDGIYYDGIAFGAATMRRVRRVMQARSPPIFTLPPWICPAALLPARSRPPLPSWPIQIVGCLPPLMKHTGVCSLTKSEHRPSSDPDSTSTRPRPDLDPDMTRPDPGRDPKSSVVSPTFDLDPQISPAQDPNPRAPSRHQISLEIR